jgi:glycosyltransferase involved in cell wall biosynthesis
MNPLLPEGADPPGVTVVIPAFRSEATIGRCLAGLESQSFRDFETIVIDSSPDALTRQVVMAGFPWVQLCRSPPQMLPHAARNAGFASARGRVLVSLDPDCVPVAEWLAHLVAPLGEGQAVVGGAIECAQRDWFSRGVHMSKFSWLLAGAPAGPRPFLATANQAWLRAEWEAFGPFSVPLWAADTELDWRRRRDGTELYFEPRAVVFHIHQATPVSFWRERRSRGEDFAQMRAELLGGRFRGRRSTSWGCRSSRWSSSRERCAARPAPDGSRKQ